MGGSKAVILFIVSLAVTVHGDVTRNGSVTSYDPSGLLLKIFNPNTTQARQRGDRFKFEDYPSGPTAEDQYIIYEDRPLKFEDSGQIDQNFEGNKPLRFQDDLSQEFDENEANEYDPIFDDDDRPFRFDGRPQISDQDEIKPLRFEDGAQNLDHNEDRPFNYKPEIPKEVSPLKFQDSDPDIKGVQNYNSIQGHNKKKRKRRRRKPKRLPNQPGLGRPGYQGVPVSPGYQEVSEGPGYQGVPGGPGYHGVPGGPNYQGVPGTYQGVPGAYQGYGAGNGYTGSQSVPFRRRRRRRRPSVGSDALTAVTGALTSIAQYDDYQCVPRLLCEAAGGGALGTAGVLDSVAGIQPLLTLLSAYNGISSSPLFVFGRAVFLGMTSKGNTGTCRYAYSQCPTDPEQLIYYLNNHNGGFFRFFNAPPNQNLQQFYQHLGQNFNQNVPYPPDYQNGQNPSDYYQNGQYPPNYQAGQNFNNYQNHQYPPNYNRPGQNYNQNGQYPADYNQAGQGQYQNGQYQNQGSFGLFPQSMYGNQNYGQNYDYNSYGKIRFRDSKEIEDRIQNKPADEADDQFDDEIYADDQDNNYNSKFAFPANYKPTESTNNGINNNKIRDHKVLRFPEDQNVQTNSNRKQKAVYFSNTNNNHPNRYNNPNRIKYVNYNEFNKIKQQPNNHNNNYYHNQNDFNDNKVKYNPNYNNNYPSNQNNLNNNNIRQQPYNHKNNYYQKYNDFNNNNNNYNSNNNNNYNLNNNNNYHKHNDLNNDDYYFDNKHGFYVKKENGKFNILYNNGNNKVYDGGNNAVSNNNNANNNVYNSGNNAVYNNGNNKVYDSGNNAAYNNNANNKVYNSGNNAVYNNGNNKVYDYKENDANVVYIVRGNGDPNHPEIVRVKPGQSVY